MRFVCSRSVFLLVISTLLSLPLGAQLVNAKLTHVPGTELERVITPSASSSNYWVGYGLAAVDTHARICCCEWARSADDERCGGCSLRSHSGINMISRGEAPAGSSAEVFLLFHVSETGVDELQAFSADCRVDATGATVRWLDGVDPDASLRLLERLFRGTHHEELAKHAAFAISVHAGAAADRILEDLLQTDRHANRSVAFWVGQNRGARGVEILDRRLRSSKDADEREDLVTGLAMSREAGAVDRLLDVAKHDPGAAVRSKALFWLAQEAGKKAAGAITQAIENDPDTAVKKHAVFALSQLPPDEGVPRLIEVARSNHNPSVRKQAVFWLGQSNDPRALAFFEEVLTR